MKFSELDDKTKIAKIRETFNGIMECLYSNNGDLEKNLTPEEFAVIKNYAPSIKQVGCDCGECVDMTKVNGRIPTELSGIINLARKRCEEKTYP